LRNVMRADRRTRDVDLEWGERAKTIELEVDQDRARLLGLDTSDVALALQMLLSGYEATQVRDGTRQVSVMLRAAPRTGWRSTASAISWWPRATAGRSR
ncbi:MAG: efflux RND transporter permease subunit, partial [Methylacidiphilales bacterium]|nr:efflux RND transporter permease subunit [Candidatus Methylacidiphilales bacterium]